MLVKSNVSVVPRKVSVSSPLIKKVCGPADPGAIVQLSISCEVCPAPAPPPPTVWKQNANSASPQVWVPSAERSSSAQPQKPPVPPKSGVLQIDGLLQLNDSPTCHMSWLAPPPYAPAGKAVPATPAKASMATRDTRTISRRTTL